MNADPARRPESLGEQVAVITGAGRGIGAAIAQSLAELGATTILCGRTAATLESTAKGISAGGGKAEAVPCDVTDLASVEAAAKRVEKSFGRVDILVNNAGIAHVGTVENTSESDLDRIYAVNVKGLFLC